jgi:hypothetical protein
VPNGLRSRTSPAGCDAATGVDFALEQKKLAANVSPAPLNCAGSADRPGKMPDCEACGDSLLCPLHAV